MRKLLVASGLISLLVGIGVLDAFLTEGGLPSAPVEEIPAGIGETATPAPVAEEPAEAPAPVGVRKGVKKQSDPDVLAVLSASALESLSDGAEESLLEKIIPRGEAVVETRILLQEGDRSGFISWAATPQVKRYFLALKEALHASFSPDLRDLIDEKQLREGKPLRDFLTFLDPGISEERIVFVRVRERLYEFHIPEGKDTVMFALIEELTK